MDMPQASPWWWIRQCLLILAAGFFLFFGISLLIAAYDLNDPYMFIMTFFASNLIILINATLLIGFVYRLKTGWSLLKKRKRS